MGKVFKSMSQLVNEINIRMGNALNIIANEVFEALMISINENVYFGDTGFNKNAISEDDTSSYKRSYEFENNAWGQSMAKRIANVMVAKVFYFPQGMSPPDMSNPYRHGNFKEGIDRRNELASILNYGGKESDYDLREFGARPFWNDLLKWVNNNWERLVMESFKKTGLNIYPIQINKKNFEKKITLNDIR